MDTPPLPQHLAIVTKHQSLTRREHANHHPAPAHGRRKHLSSSKSSSKLQHRQDRQHPLAWAGHTTTWKPPCLSRNSGPSGSNWCAKLPAATVRAHWSSPVRAPTPATGKILTTPPPTPQRRHLLEPSPSQIGVASRAQATAVKTGRCSWMRCASAKTSCRDLLLPNQCPKKTTAPLCLSTAHSASPLRSPTYAASPEAARHRAAHKTALPRTNEACQGMRNSPTTFVGRAPPPSPTASAIAVGEHRVRDAWELQSHLQSRPRERSGREGKR